MNSKRWIGSCLVVGLILTGVWSCGGQQAQKEEQRSAATRGIGEAYMRQGDYTSAMRELLSAEKLQPDDPFVHNDLGLCYMAKQLPEDAIAEFKKAIDLKPSYAPARNNLGGAYLALKKWDAAIGVFKEITGDVLYARPQYPLFNLGIAYYHKGDYDTALRYYKKALKLQPDFANALLGAGKTYLAMNQDRSALRNLKQAVKLAPKNPEAQYFLGEAYRRTGQTARARAAYETVLELTPSDADLAAKARQRLGAGR